MRRKLYDAIRKQDVAFLIHRNMTFEDTYALPGIGFLLFRVPIQLSVRGSAHLFSFH